MANKEAGVAPKAVIRFLHTNSCPQADGGASCVGASDYCPVCTPPGCCCFSPPENCPLIFLRAKSKRRGIYEVASPYGW